MDTRERILIEASRLLSVNGYHGTTTRQIAAAVGISQPSLFFHFPNKLAIVQELYEYDLIPAVAGLKNLIGSSGNAASKLYALIACELERIIDSPYDMRAHISFEALNHPDLAAFRDLLEQFDDLTRSIIEAGQKSGEFVEGDAWLVQQLVSGFLARANLFTTTNQINRLSHPEEAAAMIVRGLLMSPDSLDQVRRDAAELKPRYRRQS